ncbi:hypothetical protein STRAU_0017 [Streptomyces aurantiacus JA 4570]|uniref:Uncharacterized protein n=1 Tax=Streptomyces aurantiacus JA 4570 TaxID=1286094 RepID=S3ZU05_9ACTN|nr:hypothetical protein STRAU_0017 [Streptomyces aurantiacus JA 4570]
MLPVREGETSASSVRCDGRRSGPLRHLVDGIAMPAGRP